MPTNRESHADKYTITDSDSEQDIKEKVKRYLFSPLEQPSSSTAICVNSSCHNVASNKSKATYLCDSCLELRINCLWDTFGDDLLEEYSPIVRQPGTNEYRRQHHIPKVVLTRFAREEPNGKLTILRSDRKRDWKTREKGIKRTAFRNDLYTALSPITGRRDDLWLEQWFGTIESDFGAFLNELISNGLKTPSTYHFRNKMIDIVHAKKLTWLWLITLTIRSPHWKSMIERKIEQDEHKPQLAGVNIDDYYRFQVLSAYDQAANYNLMQHDWRIYEFRNSGLILSDHPVVGMGEDRDTKAADIWYPLDRNHLLHILPVDQSGGSRGMQQLKDTYNELAISSCSEAVYLHPGDKSTLNDCVNKQASEPFKTRNT